MDAVTVSGVKARLPREMGILAAVAARGYAKVRSRVGDVMSIVVAVRLMAVFGCGEWIRLGLDTGVEIQRGT